MNGDSFKMRVAIGKLFYRYLLDLLRYQKLGEVKKGMLEDFIVRVKQLLGLFKQVIA
jgi:hypothetical protein